MTQPQPGRPLGPLSVEEYLRREARSKRRHEYVNGTVFVMTGTTIRHNQILHNIAGRLRAAATGGRCRVFTEAIKVRIRDERFYYPDVVAACVPLDDDDVYLREPCLVVEVTSPSTKGTDAREKADHYPTIPSLQMYLVVRHNRRHVEVHRRVGERTWERSEVAGAGSIAVPCPRATLTLEEIYADVAVPRIGERAPVLYAVAP